MARYKTWEDAHAHAQGLKAHASTVALSIMGVDTRKVYVWQRCYAEILKRELLRDKWSRSDNGQQPVSLPTVPNHGDLPVWRPDGREKTDENPFLDELSFENWYPFVA